MSRPFWLLVGSLAVAMVTTLSLAWCIGACDGTPVYSPSDLAEKKCIDDAEAGVGKAAMRKNIDACRKAATEDRDAY